MLTDRRAARLFCGCSAARTVRAFPVGGAIRTVAGRYGQVGQGPNGPASAALLTRPVGIKFHAGTRALYFLDTGVVFRIDVATWYLAVSRQHLPLKPAPN